MKKHWYKDMHYAEFAESESQALLSAIKDYENNKWKTIGQKVGKPAKVLVYLSKVARISCVLGTNHRCRRPVSNMPKSTSQITLLLRKPDRSQSDAILYERAGKQMALG